MVNMALWLKLNVFEYNTAALSLKFENVELNKGF